MGILAVVVVTGIALAVVGRAVGARPLATASVAPRLSPGYAPTLLARAGFPATAHNVAVLHDHLGAAYLDAARELVPAGSFAALALRCAPARGGVPVAGGSSRAWPQRILDELAAGGAVDVAELPRRCQDSLLATAGSGRGLFGGSVFEPLPAPRAAVAALPAPRPARDAAPVATAPQAQPA